MHSWRQTKIKSPFELLLFKENVITNLHSNFLFQRLHNSKRNVNHVNITANTDICFRYFTQYSRHQQSSLICFYIVSYLTHYRKTKQKYKTPSYKCN